MADNVVKSVFWNMMNRYLPSIFQIISTIIISRHIFPGDFGAVALVTTFSQIIQIIVSSGFSQALVYKVNNSDTLYSTVFWINLFISVFFYSVFFCLSGLLESFYQIPHLSILIKVVGINIIIYGFTYIQTTLFTIKINFKTPALVTLAATIISCTIAIILAYKGFGIWAIVLQTLGINFIQTVLLWFFSSWKPLFKFSWRELTQILPYSIKVFVNDLIQSIYDNIHSLVLGKVFPVDNLGYYNRMNSIVGYSTSNFMYALASVFIPILCKKKEDEESAKESFTKILRISCYLAIPILIILMVYAKPIIVVVLTDKWISGVPYLQILTTAFLFVPFIYVSNAFLKIRNKPGVLMYTGIIKKVIGVITLFVTIHFSIMAVCWGLVLCYSLDAIICFYCNRKFLKIGLWNQIRSVFNVVILNIVLAVVLYLTGILIENNLFRIVIGLTLGGLAYFCVSALFQFEEYLILRNMILNSLRKNRI